VPPELDSSINEFSSWKGRFKENTKYNMRQENDTQRFTQVGKVRFNIKKVTTHKQ